MKDRGQACQYDYVRKSAQLGDDVREKEAALWIKTPSKQVVMDSLLTTNSKHLKAKKSNSRTKKCCKSPTMFTWNNENATI
jgi:hypothetical protein